MNRFENPDSDKRLPLDKRKTLTFNISLFRFYKGEIVNKINIEWCF